MFAYVYKGELYYINVDHISIVTVRLAISSDPYTTGYNVDISMLSNDMGCIFNFETREEAEKLARELYEMHSALFDAKTGKSTFNLGDY